MELFDVRYLHDTLDRNLEGKACIVADTIAAMIARVNNPKDAKNGAYIITKVSEAITPFENETGLKWKYAYYDPNYDAKVAWSDGKSVQYYDPDSACSEDGWVDWVLSTEPRWGKHNWRVRKAELKPDTEQTFSVGEVVRLKQRSAYQYLITGMDEANNEYYVAGAWRDAGELEKADGTDAE